MRFIFDPRISYTVNAEFFRNTRVSLILFRSRFTLGCIYSALQTRPNRNRFTHDRLVPRGTAEKRLDSVPSSSNFLRPITFRVLLLREKNTLTLPTVFKITARLTTPDSRNFALPSFFDSLRFEPSRKIGEKQLNTTN